MANRGERAFNAFNYSVLTIVALTVVLPFVILISESLMTSEDAARSGLRLFPVRPTFAAYRYILLETPVVIDGFKNSFFLVGVGTFLNLVFTAPTAYVLSKKQLPYRTAMTWFVFLPMLFSGGLVPLYLVVTWIGLNGSIWAVIAIGLISSWYTFLMRNFFAEIPVSLEESARIDGASDLRILVSVYLPLAVPAIATIGLFYAVAHWNSWFYPGIFLRSKTAWPLQVVLRELVYSLDLKLIGLQEGRGEELLRFAPKEGIKSAAIMVSALPIIMIYPFVQRYFVKGILVGAVKG
jgi:putative aldouronate transport system permease protein